MKLTARQVVVAHPMPGGGSLPALGPVSFEVPSGQFVCLVGPSGGGKSTLVRVFAGLQPPTQGQAFINEQPVLRPPLDTGLMFQEATLMPWRTVLDNVALPLELAGTDPATRHRQARALLAKLGLHEFENVYPGQLSGGMAQRVALGRVLSTRPRVLLLDEPFGALDALTREQVSLDLLTAWETEHQTVLMVTHDIHEAVLLADRVLVMSRRPGRLVDDIEVMLPRPRTPELVFTPQFMAIARHVRERVRQDYPAAAPALQRPPSQHANG